MSTHIDGLNSRSTAVRVTTDDDLADIYGDYEDEGQNKVLALEAPGNCHLVVVEGDLEEFARRVWEAVFPSPPEWDPCDECEEPATQDWPMLTPPVRLCDSCAHDAFRSGWEPGQ
jgi:hypothetical protein